MPAIEVTRLARDELALAARVGEFPRAGKQLSGVWRDCRALIGPWGWLIVVYMYLEAEDRVVVIAFHDARTSEAATAQL